MYVVVRALCGGGGYLFSAWVLFVVVAKSSAVEVGVRSSRSIVFGWRCLMIHMVVCVGGTGGTEEGWDVSVPCR